MPATPSMQNDFDRWNNIKKRLAPTVSPSSPFPQRGEVWMCALGKNLGREQDGSARDFSRPVLVVHKFNNEMFWIVPLSTKQKSLDFYFNFTDESDAAVAIVLAQLRLVSINRLHRKLYALPQNLFRQVRDRLQGLMS